MSAHRPLPSRPSLEFERKAAKSLLRELRSGDPDSIARASLPHPSIDAHDATRMRLADAQLVIAREYGFTSWPRLVRYFTDLDRQRHNGRLVQYGPEHYQAMVRSLIADHRAGRPFGARALAAYVPRFYGLKLDDIFASAISEDDARLAVARFNGLPSWEVLLEHSASRGERSGFSESDPIHDARKAIMDCDLPGLRHVVEANSDLLLRPVGSRGRQLTLLSIVLHQEKVQGLEAMRPIVEWLTSQGLDLQRELNLRLCGHIFMQPNTVRELIDRGADPTWVAPNGIPVLEHALIRYWNGDAVDLVAERAIPRSALWISAGLGDVEGVRRSLDRNGKPTLAARKLRPDFDAVGTGGWFPQHPDPDDEEILLEAFVIAMLNGRCEVVEYMVSRGFPIDTLIWGSPVINLAVGNAMIPMVECLVRCGANLDIRGWMPTQSAREIARSRLMDAPDNVNYRRVVELCGMDPDAILAEKPA